MPKPLSLGPGEIEVFRAGKYPQGTYTSADVQTLVDTYDAKNEHVAYLGVQHKPEGQPEGRAYGVIESLRRIGDSVVGKFRDTVHPAVKNAFAAGEVASWSAEIYPDYKGSGKPYLKAVKLLGAVPPAIKGLKANLAFSEDDEAGESVAIQFEEQAAASPKPAQSIGARIAAAITAALSGGTEQYEEDDPMPKDTPAPDPRVEARFAEVEQRAKDAEDRAKKLEQQFAESRRSDVARAIDTFAEQALRDGKLVKGDEEAGVRQFAAAIDGMTFEIEVPGKDGAAPTKVKREAREFFEELVGRRVTMVPEGIVGGRATRTGTKAGRMTIGAEGGRVDAESVKFEEMVQAHMDANPKATPAEAHRAVLAQTGGSSYRSQS